MAAVLVILAVVTLFVWIPNDIESGMVETFRRQTTIGDALGPTVLSIGILIASIFLGVTTWIRGGALESTVDSRPDRQSLIFLFRLAAIVIGGLLLMTYCGPLVVDIMNTLGGEIGSYRILRDTVPYKYVGYFLGGFVMVFGIIWMVEQRPSRSAALASIIAVICLIVLYDLPFDDLLLPPNGDQ